MKRFQLTWINVAAVLLLVGAAVQGQPKFSGKISGGFQAPASRDDEGRRHVLKGTDAQPLGEELFEITAPRVSSFGADNKLEMIIEAPKCIYDSGSNLAYSDSDLSFKTTDGRFSIQGKGWRWDPASSHLIISNQVVAFVQKAALAATAGVARTTNQPVRVVSENFSYNGGVATFSGNVRVEDSGDTLTCGRLVVDFQNPEGVQKIEAIDRVHLAQGETDVRGGHAVYDVRENIVRLTEKTAWKAGTREGSSDMLLLNRSNNTFFAEGNVYMKLPFTNVVSSNLTSSIESPVTNRFLQVYSGKFQFQNATTNSAPSHASYQENVRALYDRTELNCAKLDVFFLTNNQVSRIVADGQVQILRDENKAYAEQAIYDVVTDKVTLTGNPHWTSGEHEEKKGKSDSLVLYGKNREIFAFGNVEMSMPSEGTASLDLMPSRTNTSNLSASTQASRVNPSQTNPPAIVRIESDIFSHGGDVSVFQDNVRVNDGQGLLQCQLVTIYTGASNQVQRIVAQKNVQISQGDIHAQGEKATYEMAQGKIYLTGNPTIVSEGRSVEATGFIINRQANTFSVQPGQYRIKFPAKKQEQAAAK
jgi:lipopolysaccharide transport protein LptA